MNRPPFYILHNNYVYVRQPYHHPSMRDDEVQKAFAEKDQRIAELENRLVKNWVPHDLIGREIRQLQARLDAVLNTEVPFAGGMVKIRQFGQVQKALEQKDANDG